MQPVLASRAIVGLGVFFVATASLWPVVASPRSADPDALKKHAAELYRAGKYTEAMPVAERYAKTMKSRHGPGSSQYATALDNLAELYRAQGRYSGAEPLFKRALAIMEKASGPQNNLAVGEVLNNLAELYSAQGRYAEAEPLLKRVFEIREKASADKPPMATVLKDLADLYRAQGRDDEAVPLLKRALAILERAFGPDNLAIAEDLKSLADLYRALGRFAEAEPLLKRALAIREKGSGYDNLAIAEDLKGLADLYRAQGRDSEAQLLFKRALDVTVKLFSPGYFAPNLIPLALWPQFPWPPPAASASYVLVHNLFEGRRTVGEVAATIISALERSGYVERSFWQTEAGGVALVTRLERIDGDGLPLGEPERWPISEQHYTSIRDLVQSLLGLFFVDPGHYRVIVFVLQDPPFRQSSDRTTGAEAQVWLQGGLNVLPREVAARSFENGNCTALIYEFASDGNGVRKVESRLTGKQHLEKAGVLSLLGRVN